MVSKDGAEWVAPARPVPSADPTDYRPLPLDPASGALLVTGAGAEPTATSLRIAKGLSPSEADVTNGRVAVDTGLAPLTDAQLRATVVPVSTGLAPLTDAQLRATAVPVSGPLTDAQLRANAVPVSTGLAPLTDGQLRAAPVPVSGPLTDVQLRATPVPVSTGLSPLTDAQLRATPVPVTAAATLPTTDVFAVKIGQGKARIGGKQVTTSTLNQNAYFTVSNPAGNTRNVYVVGFDVYSTSSAAIQYATDFTPVNPSVGTFNPNRATSAPSSAVVYAGTTAYAGATIQPIASQINANSPLKISLLVILPPGQLLGIQVTGAAVGANISANVFFYEE